MNIKKISELKQFIEAADVSLQQARQILSDLIGDNDTNNIIKKQAKKLTSANGVGEKVIEGIFNGQSMIGPDGKKYSVPANYASKSKLVEGDVLKLTIKPDGTFLFKQIKQINRDRVKVKLLFDEINGGYSVITSEGKKYNVLSASVTYFKGEVGDEAIVLIPQNKPAEWAAIENIIKQADEEKNDYKNLKDDVNNIHLDDDLQKASIVDLDENKNISQFTDSKLNKDSQSLSSQAVSDDILPQVLNDRVDEDPKTKIEKKKIEEIINNNEELDLGDL